MGVAYIRQRYGMPWLKCGLRVTVAGRLGSVVGFHGPWVRVRFADGRGGTVVAHPCWETVYTSADGDVLRDFRSSHRQEAEGSEEPADV